MTISVNSHSISRYWLVCLDVPRSAWEGSHKKVMTWKSFLQCWPFPETKMSSFWQPMHRNKPNITYLSFWQNFHHWCHWKLSFWQLPVQPVMKVSSKWHLHFSVCEENLLVTREFSSQRASGMELCYLFVVSLNKLLSKLWSHWWFEMGWHSGDITVMNVTHLFMGKGGAPQMWSALFS